ncbi:MAG: hypothetical protein M3121_00355, partial [Chloroflexota bacterium]|nr:hypothetical protein [Chloroflexota bacterium]
PSFRGRSPLVVADALTVDAEASSRGQHQWVDAVQHPWPSRGAVVVGTNGRARGANAWGDQKADDFGAAEPSRE